MPKPFDLQKAKEGHPLVMRGGGSVKFITHVPEAIECARVIFLYDDGTVGWRREDGKCLPNSIMQSDLFLADPPMVKKERWIGLWKSNNGNFHSSNQATEKELLACVNNPCWKLIKSECIEWEEPAS